MRTFTITLTENELGYVIRGIMAEKTRYEECANDALDMIMYQKHLGTAKAFYDLYQNVVKQEIEQLDKMNGLTTKKEAAE